MDLNSMLEVFHGLSALMINFFIETLVAHSLFLLKLILVALLCGDRFSRKHGPKSKEVLQLLQEDFCKLVFQHLLEHQFLLMKDQQWLMKPKQIMFGLYWRQLRIVNLSWHLEQVVRETIKKTIAVELLKVMLTLFCLLLKSLIMEQQQSFF